MSKRVANPNGTWANLTPAQKERHKAHVRRWRKENPVHSRRLNRERMRRWSAANRPEDRRIRAAWAAANPEKIRAQKRRHYLAHGPKIRRRVKRWRLENSAYLAKYLKERKARLLRLDPEAYRKSVRVRSLQYRYGLSPDAYLALLKKQRGRCALCGRRPFKGKNLSVDHDHSTGTVRGLLHGTCNSMLGMVGDSKEFLVAAILYLEGSL